MRLPKEGSKNFIDRTGMLEILNAFFEDFITSNPTMLEPGYKPPVSSDVKIFNKLRDKFLLERGRPLLEKR